jgi:hypothetical protein
MSSFRKVVGFLIIVFVGLPLLFAITWAVGLTRAATSPKLVSEAPLKIIAAVPGMIDEFVREGQNADLVKDADTRAWLQAIAKSPTPPRELLVKLGILPWMQGELQVALGKLGDVLRGRRPPDRISIDLRPLKKALLDPSVEDYVIGVLKNLPPCDDAGMRRWTDNGWGDQGRVHLPPCQPDLDAARAAVRIEQARIVGRMNDEIEIFQNVRFVPYEFSHVLTYLLYALFIIPAIFILGGALVAASSPADFLRWSGIPTLIGGLSALGPALFVRTSAFYFERWALFRHGRDWSFDFGPLVLEKTRWAIRIVLEPLLNPVIAAAGAVCVVGLILIALSFSARSHRNPAPPAPAA